MLQSLQKSVAVALPRVPWKVLASASSLVGFVWLLTQDQVHPIVVYLLQLYLAF